MDFILLKKFIWLKETASELADKGNYFEQAKETAALHLEKKHLQKKHLKSKETATLP
jgi:hypothetical protein